jgi:PKD repeat protein
MVVTLQDIAQRDIGGKMNPTSRARRQLAAAAVTLAVAGIGVAAEYGTASASAKASNFSLELSGDQPEISLFQSPAILCDECLPDDFVDGGAKAYLGLVAEGSLNLHYEAPAMTTVAYDDSFLRQGSTMNVTDTLVMMPGTVHSVWKFELDVLPYVEDADGNPIQQDLIPELDPIPDVVMSQDFACLLPASGSTTCAPDTVLSFPIASVEIFPGISIGMNFNVDATMDVTSDGVVTLREADVVAGQPGVNSSELTFQGSSPSVVSDPLLLGCDEPAGNTVTYALTDPSYPLEAEIGIGLSLDVSFNHWFGSETIANIWSDTLATAPLDPVVLHGDDMSLELGTLGADNFPPVADSTSPLYAGKEGTPIQFNGNGSTDNCGTPTLVWQFSDGGIAFGPEPKHTFADNGTYTGLLTATDAKGNVDTDLFTVAVTNEAPIAAAGPDHLVAWGRPVQFGGSAVDPGSADQASLNYTWNFGDGSPSAAGGPNTVHSYAAPGDYEATLTVCDKDLACNTDSRNITVRRRNATLSVVGSTNGVYDTPGQVSASVVDEFGAPVSNRVVTFALDGVAIGTTATSSNGTATLVYAPQVPAGAHSLSATMAQDAFYNGPATGSGTFNVAKKATTVTYTGPVTGAPNKVINLSASLVDATGTPLAGRTINFTLGTQTASATTDANGAATASLKLTQKNGTYTVSASFAPTGNDASRYNGSAASASFKLQAK